MSDNKQWILYGILGGSITFNFLNIFSESTTEQAIVNHIEEMEVLPEDIDQAVVEDAELPTVQSQEKSQNSSTSILSSEWSVIHASVQSNLTVTFRESGVEDADGLSSVFSRLFVWDVNMGKDLQPGDKVEVIYRTGEDGFPEIAAARLNSKKYGKTFTAFQWKAPNDKYPSYWMFDGTEVSYQLKNSPINDYEQVISLLKDGRGHKGMDFKAPVGTPSFSPQKGVVTRVNFGNSRYNGNCVEVKYADGTLAKWLHMEKITVKEGQTVNAGDQVGLVGNTGRSFGPHLHYQLNQSNGNVIDPVKYHGTYRRKLHDRDVTAFLQDVGVYINALDTSILAER